MPVKEEMHRHSAEVPDCMGIQDPEQRREVEQLQQGQAMEQHHHHATLPPVGQCPPVLPAPTQPPQQVHYACGRDREQEVVERGGNEEREGGGGRG